MIVTVPSKNNANVRVLKKEFIFIFLMLSGSFKLTHDYA